MGNSIIMTGGAGGIDPDECTAGRPQVLSGYTAGVHGEDDPAPGSMPERGAWTGSVGMNGSVIIPDGHHNGLGKVNGPSVTQRGTWTSALGINGKVMIPEGYHNGQGYVNQSIATLGGQTITPSASQQTVACSGKYMTGNVVVNSCYAYKSITYRMLSASSTMQFATTETTNTVGNWMLNGAYIESAVNDFSKIKMILIYKSNVAYPNNKPSTNLTAMYDIDTIDTWNRCSVWVDKEESVAVWGNCYINQNGSFRIPVITKAVKFGDQIPNNYFNWPYNVKIIGY